MKKIGKNITLSVVVSSLVFSPALALPSGGKFTHGTSGSINTSGNTMNIIGNNKNSVIQWGGGFSISQGERVNFGNDKFKGKQNYLNIAHGAKKSIIDGVLNANSNNVFLINANGVLITKNGQVNANRFVASTSSIDNAVIQNFADNKLNYNTFSPVFKPNKGNVVNLGNIKTLQDTTLIGENILNEGSIISKYDKDNLSSIKLIGKNIKNTGSMNTNYIKSYDNTNQNKLNIFENTGSLEASQEIDLKANESISNKGDITTNTLNLKAKDVVLDKNIILNNSVENSSINIISANNINLDATNSYIDIASIDGVKLTNNGFKTNGKVETYLDASGYYYNPNSFLVFNKFTNNSQLNKRNYVSLNDVTDWWYFAKGWNDHHEASLQDTFRNNASWYKLTNNIDFGANEGKNYANYYIDGLGYTSMIVGAYGYLDYNTGKYIGSFNKNFDGQGYTLSNINIDTTNLINKPNGIGIFGYISGGDFKNINVDYKNGSINVGGDSAYAGGFAGWIDNGKFSKIYIKNIHTMSSNIDKKYIFMGGFTGRAYNAEFTNISIDNIKSINNYNMNTGGFAGLAIGKFDKITINNIGNIKAYTASGGFAGSGQGEFTNIILNNIGDIYGEENAGGFGWINSPSTLENIYIYFKPNAEINGGDKGIFASKILGDTDLNFNNIYLYYNNQFNNLQFVGNTTSYDNKFTHLEKNYEEFINDATTNISGLEKEFCEKQTCLVFTKTNPPNTTPPNKPNISNIPNINTNPTTPDDNIILDSDDLLSQNLLNQILADLKNNHYEINLGDLAIIANFLDSLNNRSQKEKAKFLVDYVLGANLDKFEGDKLKLAYSIVQSIDFIKAYKGNDFSNASFVDISLANLAKDLKKQSSNHYDIVLRNINTIKQLNNQANVISNSSKNYNNSYNNIYPKLNDLINQYNAIIAEYEKSEIMTEQIIAVLKGLEAEINNHLNHLNTLANHTNNDIKTFENISFNDPNNSFKINGSFMKLGKLNVKLAPIPDGSVDPEIPDRPDRPDRPVNPVDPIDPINPIDPIYPQDINKPDQLFSQVNASDDENEEANIDEVAKEQRLKTCIVNDNFKTMNPCVVGSISQKD